MRIIDPETGEALPTGELGEITIKGTTLMKAYNKTFPETYLDDAGYYRTKDAGFFDQEGWLHWTGRMSEVIRTNAQTSRRPRSRRRSTEPRHQGRGRYRRARRVVRRAGRRLRRSGGGRARSPRRASAPS